MKIVLFYDEPNKEIKNYNKNGYSVIDGEFKNEKDIIKAYCDQHGLDKNFWYKLLLKPIELTDDLLFLLPKGVKFTYQITHNHSKYFDIKTYRVEKKMKLSSFTTKDGLVVHLPNNLTCTDNIFFFCEDDSIDLSSIIPAIESHGIKPIFLNKNINLVSFVEE